MLYMIGLEPYRERYTAQLDGAGGWWDRNLKKADVGYTRIDGARLDMYMPLDKGVVLDPLGRAIWGFEQTKRLIGLAYQGDITDDDVLYFSDFWHPGFEMLPYTFQQLGVKPRMYAFCHAQSVDEYDFTHPMRHWMRHFERGIGEVLDGIFVSCPSMKDKLARGLWPGGYREDKVHACGHVWSTEEVMERMPPTYVNQFSDSQKGFPPPPRKNQVVFSSRWDAEKNPRFFLQVATAVRAVMPDARFVVCSSAPKMRSNDPNLLLELEQARKLGLVEVRENLTKEEYYATLCESKVQFNCSSQDWVSYVLLEASAAGCFPIYPHFRSFPETFLREPQFMYDHLSLESAAVKVLTVLMSNAWWTPEAIQSRSWIHRRFDTTCQRMLQVMGVPFPDFTVTADLRPVPDPFDREGWL